MTLKLRLEGLTSFYPPLNININILAEPVVLYVLQPVIKVLLR